MFPQTGVLTSPKYAKVTKAAFEMNHDFEKLMRKIRSRNQTTLIQGHPALDGVVKLRHDSSSPVKDSDKNKNSVLYQSLKKLSNRNRKESQPGIDALPHVPISGQRDIYGSKQQVLVSPHRRHISLIPKNMFDRADFPPNSPKHGETSPTNSINLSRIPEHDYSRKKTILIREIGSNKPLNPIEASDQKNKNFIANRNLPGAYPTARIDNLTKQTDYHHLIFSSRGSSLEIKNQSGLGSQDSPLKNIPASLVLEDIRNQSQRPSALSFKGGDISQGSKDISTAIGSNSIVHISSQFGLKNSKVSQPVVSLKWLQNLDGPESRFSAGQGFKIDWEICPSIKLDYSLEFKLEKILGEGHSSKVFKGFDFRLNTIVAVKVIEFRKLEKDYLKKLLQSEIDIWSSLNHPNIARLYRVLQDGSKLYLVQQFCGTSTLTQLTEKKELGDSQIKSIFKQTVEAVAYLHSLNVAHRDLKFSNIMITDAGIVKLIDLGFACKGDHTQNLFCGTPAYMPPELFDEGNYHPLPVDIWSLGVILFKLVTHNYPFGSNKDKNLQRRIEGCRFILPLGTDLKVKDLIHKLLCIWPQERLKAVEILNHSWFLPRERFL